MKRALFYVPDLFFAPRITDALGHLGFTTLEVNLRAAEFPQAELMVVQLEGTPAIWAGLIQRARDARIPVLAFGRHTEPQTLRAARQAGAEKVVPNSELVNGLPELVAQLLATRTSEQPSAHDENT